MEGGGEGSFLVDDDGNRYLDCYGGAGTYNLGRRNREIIAELRSAAREIDQGNFVMLSEQKAMLGRRLDEFLPGNLECMLLGVVRGEGVDAACKLARGRTGRKNIITVDGGWYGQTGFALTLSDRGDKRLFGELIPEVTTIPYGDITAARKAISRKTAAFVIEPVQAENHCRTADFGYYREIRRLCSKKGAILVFDETQTGFGRTGKKFAYEHFNIVPDILVFGEAITGGIFPMTGIAFTRKLKSFFDAHPLIHLCTFGGHDVGCRVACAAMDVYERTKPWQNALLVGDMLRNLFLDVARKYPEVIRSVSGTGLLLSLSFADESKANHFCITAKKHGLFAVPGRVAKNSVVLRPALTLGLDEMKSIGRAVSQTAGEL
ncbi:MAG TPA: aminotransferase class III-fold pyridoxal phosphate-dependent enzyme [Spirochaetota bacterium]|nr:aminotransferase class III-fold pyridoxal phosphate-dependent enzyme [Spirochaetota bacterium]